MSRADYEALVRAAERTWDTAAIWEAEAENDYLPADSVRRLVAGESPVRVYREVRGLTQQALAERVGVGKSFLSQVEKRGKSPSVAVLRRLADALDVTLDDLA
ncbi:MAG: XRE family transcriptional regulator [Rhodospirillales bacterium]|nr:XRE family transcriptional regulator [Rhodospirillales bacterium]